MTENDYQGMDYFISLLDDTKSAAEQLPEILISLLKKVWEDNKKLRAEAKPAFDYAESVDVTNKNKAPITLQSNIPAIKEKLSQKKTPTHWIVGYEKDRLDIRARKEVKDKAYNLSFQQMVVLVPVGTPEHEKETLVAKLTETYGCFVVDRVVESDKMTQGQAAIVRASDYFTQQHVISEGLAKEASGTYYEGPPIPNATRLSLDRET